MVLRSQGLNTTQQGMMMDDYQSLIAEIETSTSELWLADIAAHRTYELTDEQSDEIQQQADALERGQ